MQAEPRQGEHESETSNSSKGFAIPKVAERTVVRKMGESLLILFVSAVLLLFLLLPTTPIHSSEVSAAYSRYINMPSEKTRKDYEDAIKRVNRPLRIAQSISGISGIAVLFLLLRVWRRQRVARA